MLHIDDRISEKNAWPQTRWGRPVLQTCPTIGARIARAAHAFELRRTKHARKWVAVFMNEETMVLALHGALTGAERAHAQSAAGVADVQESHRRLFADFSGLLLRKIKGITGMDMRHISAEIDWTLGCVVHLFMTDTAGEEFPRAPSGFTGMSTPDPGPLGRHER